METQILWLTMYRKTTERNDHRLYMYTVSCLNFTFFECSNLFIINLEYFSYRYFFIQDVGKFLQHRRNESLPLLHTPLQRSYGIEAVSQKYMYQNYVLYMKYVVHFYNQEYNLDGYFNYHQSGKTVILKGQVIVRTKQRKEISISPICVYCHDEHNIMNDERQSEWQNHWVVTNNSFL